MLLLGALLTAFHFSYVYDNKYTIPMPLPQRNTLPLTEDLLQAGSPIFLIDGWKFYYGAAEPEDLSSKHSHKTFIGEYPNFRREDADYRRWLSNLSPLGAGTYSLALTYAGAPMPVMLELPELFTHYRLWLDDALLKEGDGTARVSFLLTPGEHRLTVSVAAQQGYYAGMYYPGILGTADTVLKVERVKTLVYAVAFLSPLVLSFFSLFLWRLTGDRLRGRFALLCLSFALYVSYYFVQLYNLPFAPFWYLVEDMALYGFLYFAVALSVEAIGLRKSGWGRITTLVAVAFPVAEALLYLLTPYWNAAVTMHSLLQDIYRVLIFLCLTLSSVKIWSAPNRENAFVLAGNAALGLGIIVNLLKANLFEPIYTLWQFEWCGLLLVGLFAAMMVTQNRRLLTENAAYSARLEDMVNERTKEISCLLEERRAFFSDMAHDLKAPLFATKTFIEMIRRHSVGVDQELTYYIAQVEQKQNEMSRRVQSLNELNAVDKLTATPEIIFADELLAEVEQTHNPEAVVGGVHLIVQRAEAGLAVLAQREKLLLAFENLIFNALRFTPAGGLIVIAAEREGEMARFSVADTGCGIPADELPQVFDRFFVGTAGKKEGSGLGLYIVKGIVEEAGGTITVASDHGGGCAFTFLLPLAKAPNTAQPPISGTKLEQMM